MTDGRFSGGSVGLVIGHVGPEAAIGGPIALIEDGDEIIVDLNKNEINCSQLNDTNIFNLEKAIGKKFSKLMVAHIQQLEMQIRDCLIE